MTDSRISPARQLWAKARGGPVAELSSLATPLLRRGEPIAFVGGKLAAGLVAPLAEAGFPAVFSDRRHPVLADIAPDAAEYEVFGHGYGELHTAREFRQLVERAARTFAPQEDRWREADRVIDPFRPNLRYSATTDQEFDVLQERHLNAVRTAFRRATTVIVALSQSEIWESRADGAVFPHWISAGERHFDPEKHSVRALTVEETVLDLVAAAKALRALNPALSIVLMLSPEPQLATTYAAHVQVAGTVGKAVLRIAMEMVAGTEGLVYFPAFEIATLRACTDDFGADGSVPPRATDEIVKALLAISDGGDATFVGEASPIPVLQARPAEQRAPKQARLEAATSPAAGDAGQAEVAEVPARKPKPKAKSLAISVVDSYSLAKAAEERERAKKRAAGGEAWSPTIRDRPTLSVAERQAMRQEKLAAREAKLAAPKTPPVEKAETPAAAAPSPRKAQRVVPAAAEPAAGKEKRRAKKARANSDGAGTNEEKEAAGAKSRQRREGKNALKS